MKLAFESTILSGISSQTTVCFNDSWRSWAGKPQTRYARAPKRYM